MLKNLSFAVLLLTLPRIASSQEVPRPQEARRIADEATQTARAGKLDDALRLYGTALTLAPDDVSILRDYAVVLGWAEKYSQAIPIIRSLLSVQGDQPDWALREFSRSLLYGNETQEALRRLNQLVERGDYTEPTLTRRAVAMRWLGRSDDAEIAYADLKRRYPESGTSYAGLAYIQADRGRLSDALRLLDGAPGPLQNEPDIAVARTQILNWMGRHYEAQRVIAGLSPTLAGNREILKESVLAERWGGNPAGAMRELMRLESLYPDRSSRELMSEFRTEYGHSVTPSFRYSRDSDGLVDRATALEAAFHLNPAHVLRVGYQYRWLEQSPLDSRTLVRYDLGWSGSLNRHVALFTTLSSVDYRTPGLSRKIVGDGSLRLTLNDKVRVEGGGGVIVMDAFQALPTQVTAPFGFGQVGLAAGRNKFTGRYSHYAFSDGVTRQRLNGEYMRSLFEESAVRISAGFRASVMTHSASTPDFYSPARLQSYFGVGQFSGRLTSWMDYSAEVAAGWQAESGSPIMHPFQVSGGVGWQPVRQVRLSVDGARSTASMDRLGPGLRTYSRWAASGSVEIRFP